jgi:hypothetical protein
MVEIQSMRSFSRIALVSQGAAVILSAGLAGSYANDGNWVGVVWLVTAVLGTYTLCLQAKYL